MATKTEKATKKVEESKEAETEKYQGGEIPRTRPRENEPERSSGSNEEAASYSTD